MESVPIIDYRDQPPECLMWGENWGIHLGRIYHYADGRIVRRVAHINGDIEELTHWQPLPKPPSEGAQ